MEHLSNAPWRSEVHERSGQGGVKRQRVASGHGHAEVEDECCAVDDVVLDEDPWKKDPSNVGAPLWLPSSGTILGIAWRLPCLGIRYDVRKRSTR